MSTRWIDSPIGGLRLHASAGLLTRIEFDAEPVGRRVADPVLDLAEEQLAAYFAGRRALSRVVTLQEINRRSLPERLRDSFAWLFSPYL